VAFFAIESFLRRLARFPPRTDCCVLVLNVPKLPELPEPSPQPTRASRALS
jgi:hypothetical protein